MNLARRSVTDRLTDPGHLPEVEILVLELASFLFCCPTIPRKIMQPRSNCCLVGSDIETKDPVSHHYYYQYCVAVARLIGSNNCAIRQSQTFGGPKRL